MGREQVETLRLAVVTGGSRGLGASLCNALRRQGFRVVEFSRTAPHEFSVQVDLSSPESARQKIAEALLPLSDLHWDEIVMINNAGVLNPVGASSQQRCDSVVANINSNFTSAILFMSVAVAKFQGHSCRKVLANISSGAALKGMAGWSLYCAAKAGIENFIRSLALEQVAQVAPFVAINIGPGLIDTEMQAVIRASARTDFPDVANFIAYKESGALSAPGAVAASILKIIALPKLINGGRYLVADYPC
jgi:benzil reductase ((S)-benzoin forming)